MVMKRKDSGHFCILYLEPNDERNALLRVIVGQQKHVVLMLAQQSRLFQRPEEFVALKHIKRQLGVSIFFVISQSESVVQQLAERNGFPVYRSMDALSKELTVGHLPPGYPTLPQPSMLAVQRSLPPRPVAPLPSEQEMMPTVPPVIRSKKNAARLPRGLIALMVLALSAGSLGWLLVFFHAPTANGQVASLVVGHVYFLSSGQVNENTNQGIDDEVEVDLHNLANPAPGKNYYTWLLGDKSQSEPQAVFLGVLQVNKGEAHLFYSGGQQHTNLLAITSRFLVTEEDASVTPLAPSPDYNTWRYYGEFLQTPVQSSSSMPDMGSIGHYSFLDHLRYLLVADPMLAQNGLAGGLNNWLSQNVEKVLALTGSMRETWEESKDIVFVRHQTVRILSYLDGLSYVSQDIPSDAALGLNDQSARIGLLEVNGPNQDPLCYLDSIMLHLNGLIRAGGSTPTLRKEIDEIITALNNVRYWLAQVRKDGKQIMKMSDSQLLQPLALAIIDDMVGNASNAYAGQMDPTTNMMREGVAWIHDHTQALATLDITSYKANSSPIQMVPQIKSSSLLSWLSGGFLPWSWGFLFQIVPQVSHLWQLLGLICLALMLLLLCGALIAAFIKVVPCWWNDLRKRRHFLRDRQEAEHLAEQMVANEMHVAPVAGTFLQQRYSTPHFPQAARTVSHRTPLPSEAVRPVEPHLRTLQIVPPEPLASKPVERQASSPAAQYASQGQVRGQLRLIPRSGEVYEQRSGTEDEFPEIESVQQRKPLSLEVGVGLHPGFRRKDPPNEDALFEIRGTHTARLELQQVGLFVVAGGMGTGSEHEASCLAIQELSAAMVPALLSNTKVVFADLLKEGMQSANLAIYRRNRELADMNRKLGTTMTAALIVGRRAHIANVGNSRTYLYRLDQGLMQVTHDHVLAASFLGEGMNPAYRVPARPHYTVLERYLGKHASVEVDLFAVDLRAGNVLLLCSDGLWTMMCEPELAEILSSPAIHPTQMSAMLVQKALNRGVTDCISAIVIRYPGNEGEE
jgi:serine/threonine protein phosphatase PrpC